MFSSGPAQPSPAPATVPSSATSTAIAPVGTDSDPTTDWSDTLYTTTPELFSAAR